MGKSQLEIPVESTQTQFEILLNTLDEPNMDNYKVYFPTAYSDDGNWARKISESQTTWDGSSSSAISTLYNQDILSNICSHHRNMTSVKNATMDNMLPNRIPGMWL